jgi:hypothetical protein
MIALESTACGNPARPACLFFDLKKCMLWEQSIYFLCIGRNLAKFLARILIVWVADERSRRTGRSGFLNRADSTRGIRLESAAGVLHMNCVT